MCIRDSHSTLGRAKKSLAGKPELGDTGDLFLSVAHIVAHHLPSACVFENVPAFGNSLACLSLAQHLQKIGYCLTESIIDPLNEWNEPQDRKRWIMVATLKPGFQIRSPQIPFTGTVGKFLEDVYKRQLCGGRTLTLRRNAELRFGKVRRESPVHADSEIGAPLSVMPHSCSVKVRVSVDPDVFREGAENSTREMCIRDRWNAHHARG